MIWLYHCSGVPSVDKRDKAFAKAHDLPILTVTDKRVLVNSAQVLTLHTVTQTV